MPPPSNVSTEALDRPSSPTPQGQQPTPSHPAHAIGAEARKRQEKKTPRKVRNEDNDNKLRNHKSGRGSPGSRSQRHGPRNNATKREAVPVKQGGRSGTPTIDAAVHELPDSLSPADKLKHDHDHGVSARRPKHGSGRRRGINGKLTGAGSGTSSENVQQPKQPIRSAKADNLTNRLIDSLRTPPYADCPICFNSIHPAQPIWSCSPSSPGVSEGTYFSLFV